MTDRTMAVEAVRKLLVALGQDPTTDALKETPTRVTKAWEEMLSGYTQTANEILTKDFDADGYDQQILLGNISFYSTCEHHLLPFHGHAWVAYIPKPGGRVVGLSKLARLVEMHARRLQLQERMTQDIANDLQRALSPTGVAVLVKAQHLCMCARGVQKPGSVMITSVMLGCYRDNDSARNEFLKLGGIND